MRPCPSQHLVHPLQRGLDRRRVAEVAKDDREIFAEVGDRLLGVTDEGSDGCAAVHQAADDVRSDCSRCAGDRGPWSSRDFFHEPALGSMLAFIRKKLSGSCLFLSSLRRCSLEP